MKKYTLFIILITGLFSCENFLDVKPKSQIIDKDLFATSEGCEEALYGVYASMAVNGLYGFNLRCGSIEVMGQAYSVINQGRDNDTKEFVITDDLRKDMSDIWTEMYKAIGYVNNLITTLEDKKPNAFLHSNLYLGEALGVRAFMHFDLLRMFGPHVERHPDKRGIPYVKRWTVGVTPFSTVKEAYAEVVADLKASEGYLLKGEEEIGAKETSFTRNRRIHFNLQAAQATLARVYWMRGDLDSARIYAEKVIKSNVWQLERSSGIGKMHLGVVGDKETIFGLYSMMAMPSYKSRFYDVVLGSNTPQYTPRKDYQEMYQAEAGGNETRLSWFREERKVLNPGSEQQQEVTTNYFTKHFSFAQIASSSYFYEGNDRIAGFGLVTLPEMYLIAAEALLEKDPGQALIYFDTFINSRGLTKFADRQGEQKKELTLNEIYKERTKEFIGDGQEFFAMKKQLRALASKELTDEDYTFIIPDGEFDFRQDETETNNEPLK